MRIRRKTAGLVVGLTLTSGALLAAVATPAQAYSPNPTATATFVDTGDCPCTLSDPFDGTYFDQDAGSKAVKIEMRDSSGSYVAKTEFHPASGQLWVYDTMNDGDTVYTRIKWTDADGVSHNRIYSPPGTSAVLDYSTIDLSIPHGNPVWIWVYDDSNGTDQIWGGRAIA